MKEKEAYMCTYAQYKKSGLIKNREKKRDGGGGGV